MNEWLVILNLDGTLFSENVTTSEEIPSLRPYTKAFINFLFKHCREVAIWSNSGSERVQRLYEKLLLLLSESKFSSGRSEENKFSFIWSAEKSTEKIKVNSYFDCSSISSVKHLKKLWTHSSSNNCNNTLIIDDTPRTYSCNFGNAIPIPKFVDYTKDTYLLQLMKKMRQWESQYENQNIKLFSDLFGSDGEKIRSLVHTYTPIKSVRLIDKKSWFT